MVSPSQIDESITSGTGISVFTWLAQSGAQAVRFLCMRSWVQTQADTIYLLFFILFDLTYIYFDLWSSNDGILHNAKYHRLETTVLAQSYHTM